VAGVLAGCDSAEERAADHFESGMALLEEDKPVKASLEFRNTLKLVPKHPEANYQLGKLREEDGKLQSAAGLYRRALEFDPKFLDAHLDYARIMLVANQLDEAWKSVGRAYRLAPDRADVLALKAAAEFRRNEIVQAQDTLEAGFAVDESHPELWTVKVALERKTGDADAALAAAEKGLSYQPGHVSLSIVRMALLNAQGREGDVIEALSDLVAEQPERLDLREELIRRQLRSGDHAAAEANLRTIVDQFPDKPERKIDVVIFLARTQGADAALAELDRMIAEAEDAQAATPFRSAKIRLLMAQGERDRVKDILRGAIDALDTEPEGLEARVALAEMLLAEGDRTPAEQLIDEVLSADAANAGALSLRGALHVEDKDYQSAIRDLRKALGEEPDNLRALQQLARAHRRTGNKALAGERLADAVTVSEHAEGPVLAYVRFLMGEGNVNAAEGLLEAALEKSPRNRAMLEALASIRLRKQDWIGAEEIAERLDRLGEDPEQARQVMAAALAGQRRFDESLNTLVGTGDGVEPSTDLASLVRAYLRADKAEEARATVVDALESNPDDPVALRLKGAFAVDDGDMDEARRLLTASVEAAPQDPTGYAVLARYHGRQGDLEAVLSTLREGVEVTDSSGLRMALAALQESRGNSGAAIDLYRPVLDRNPDFDVAANNLASLVMEDDPTEAELQEASRLAQRLRGSDVPQFQDTYGWMNHLLGNHDEALPSLAAAVEALPGHPVVQYHYGMALSAVGRSEEARDALEKAIEVADRYPPFDVDKARAGLDALASPDAGE